METTIADYSQFSIAQISYCVYADLRKQSKSVPFGAKPYLDAMSCLETVDDNYGADSGVSVVAYFLSNATTYRGEIAKAIKKELNKRIK